MFGYSLELIAIISLAVCLGGVVKGVTGIGLPIVAIAVLVNFLDPLTTFATLIIPILVTNLWQAVTARDWKVPFKRFRWMIVCFVACLFVGAELAVTVDTGVLLIVLGVSVAVFAASNLVKPRAQPLSPAVERVAGPFAGALGGVLGGMTAIWGPPMMMLFVMLKLDKDDWVQTVGLVWFIGSVPLTYAYWRNGMLNAETAPLSAYACVPGMLGIWLGEVVRRRINQETFRKVMLTALLIIGLNLIRRALF
ncbi:MAG: sulfite exporter TauE/SafE family protein [Magnetovibrio sp.]|nr:sulfite exporter TauE/SafE family protein [Magnetovibrio sp.]